MSDVWPGRLQTILISEAFERGDIEKSKEIGSDGCIECGKMFFYLSF